MTALLELQNVSRHYGGGLFSRRQVMAVRDVILRLEQGQPLLFRAEWCTSSSSDVHISGIPKTDLAATAFREEDRAGPSDRRSAGSASLHRLRACEEFYSS